MLEHLGQADEMAAILERTTKNVTWLAANPKLKDAAGAFSALKPLAAEVRDMITAAREVSDC